MVGDHSFWLNMVSESSSENGGGRGSRDAFIEIISRESGLSKKSVAATAALLSEGATVPFISRYRKEATGSLDEVAITLVRDRMQQLADLESRKSAILKSLKERNLLTPDLEKKVFEAESLTRLEDVFAPYRPKRRTRATMAKEKGLEPLANWILDNQSCSADSLNNNAEQFLNPSEDKDKNVADITAALSGARDIIAEIMSDDVAVRTRMRTLYRDSAIVTSKVLSDKEEDPAAGRFKDYFDWREPLSKTPSHRLLAMRRGEAEGVLIFRIKVEEEEGVRILVRAYVTGRGGGADQVAQAAEDSFKRLLSSSMETEFRLNSKKAADEEAVKVFAENIRELIMAAPLGQKVVLAIDPGFRTGCKTVVLDAQGNLLHDDVIHATTGSKFQIEEARDKVSKWVEHFKVEAIAVGNGTASRETEAFIKSCELSKSVMVVMVNESGASIYSASDVARKEFPDKDVTVRGAVSIGRRLMDPLAELVKIDPKSIGVGQYQHDVDQNLLQKSLDDTVISCVNRVGVEVNTASLELLKYVSGLNSTIAENIIAYRAEHGPFKSRAELKKVPRLGERTYEQAAGFLRVKGATNPLDESAVHPERYKLVKTIAADSGVSLKELMQNKNSRDHIQLEKYISGDVGLPTLKDIFEELDKPGRDPRSQFEAFSFADHIEKPEDLSIGMKVPGIVTNVTKFGAFVDIGVHQDGLVHISQLADKFISDPAEVVKVAQKVMVTVVELDLARKRIGLSMKANPMADPQNRNDRMERNPHPSQKNSGRDRKQRSPKPPGNGFNQPIGLNALEDALNNLNTSPKKK